jgi:hypothetical protein
MAKPVAERVKASRIRRKAVEGIPLSDDEAASLEDYESSKPPQRKGKSASSRVVHLDIEEQAAAEGDHVHPEAYAAIARSEGLRADTLLNIVTNRLMQCNEQYLILLTHCMERSERLENAHIGLIEAMRDSHLARIEAEGEAKIAQQIAESAGDDDELASIMKMLAPVIAARMGKAQDKDAKSKPKRKKPEKPLGSID